LIGKHRPIKPLTIAFQAVSDTVETNAMADRAPRANGSFPATASKTLRVAQVRRISWVRRVGRLGAVGVASSKTPLLTGHRLSKNIATTA